MTAIGQQIEHCRRRGQWERVQCIELVVVRGCQNKEVAAMLGVSEQAVANYQFEFFTKLRAAVRSQRLPEDVFPELYP